MVSAEMRVGSAAKTLVRSAGRLFFAGTIVMAEIFAFGCREQPAGHARQSGDSKDAEIVWGQPRADVLLGLSLDKTVYASCEPIVCSIYLCCTNGRLFKADSAVTNDVCVYIYDKDKDRTLRALNVSVSNVVSSGMSVHVVGPLPHLVKRVTVLSSGFKTPRNFEDTCDMHFVPMFTGPFLSPAKYSLSIWMVVKDASDHMTTVCSGVELFQVVWNPELDKEILRIEKEEGLRKGSESPSGESHTRHVEHRGCGDMEKRGEPHLVLVRGRLRNADENRRPCRTPPICPGRR